MTIANPKRKEIMQRSIKLGHCICDPRRGCPCDVFTGQGICPCAGERPEPVDISQVKLTSLVHNAGCASKIAPADLERFLSSLPEVHDPAIISGLPAGDDAAVYKIADGVTIVQTVDVFTPCADDPHLFGRICAANCLSDIYAMGATPRTALSILAFPSDTQDGRLMHLMLAGAMETLAEANCSLLGGHSIKDEEIKLGFAITGIAEEGKAIALDAMNPGDLLVLTKPLGVGVLSFASQIGKASAAGLAQAQQSMATLNKNASAAMMEAQASACTDITGFGLFGHLVRMVRESGAGVTIFADSLPAFDGALDALRAGIIPGAIERNREFVGTDLLAGPDVDEAYVNLGLDAQTSGGLLIAIEPQRYEKLMHALAGRNVQAWTIGEVSSSHAGKIRLAMNRQAPPPVAANAPAVSHEDCCADVFASAAAPSDASRAFGALMRATAAGGKIDQKTKELINFALVVMSRCEPCIEAHLKKARDMGISPQELDEAAWCATAMGGAPVKLFYDKWKGK